MVFEGLRGRRRACIRCNWPQRWLVSMAALRWMQLTHGSKGYVSKPSSPLAIIQQLDRCGERFVWNNLDLQFDRRAPTRSLTNFFTMHYSTARSRRTALDPVLPSSSKASLAMTSLPRIRAAIVGAETREVLGNTRVRCGRKRSMKAVLVRSADEASGCTRRTKHPSSAPP